MMKGIIARQQHDGVGGSQGEGGCERWLEKYSRTRSNLSDSEIETGSSLVVVDFNGQDYIILI